MLSDSEGEENTPTSNLSSDLLDALDGLFVSRTDIREETLEKMVDGLKNNYLHAFVQKEAPNLCRAINSGISSPKSKREHLLTNELLILVAITLGVEGNYFLDFQKLLTKSVQKGADSATKASDVKAYAIIDFLWCEEQDTTQQHIESLMNIIHEGIEEMDFSQNIQFYCSVLDAIALLCSSMDNEYIIDEVITSIAENLISIISTDESEVRFSAAHLFGFLVSILQEEDDDYTPFYFNSFFDVNHFISTLKDLTTSSRGVSKKAWAKQKSLAPFLATFEEGKGPTVINLIINKQNFSFTTWTDIVRLEFIRNVLGPGFQCHFQFNDLLGDILGYTIDESKARLTKWEKKSLLMEKYSESKHRGQERERSRAQKYHDSYESV